VRLGGDTGGRPSALDWAAATVAGRLLCFRAHASLEHAMAATRSAPRLDRHLARSLRADSNGGKLISKKEVRALFAAALQDKKITAAESGSIVKAHAKADRFSYGAALDFGRQATQLKLPHAHAPQKDLNAEGRAVSNAFTSKWDDDKGVIGADALKAALKTARADGKVTDAERYALAACRDDSDDETHAFTKEAAKLKKAIDSKYRLSAVYL
jgi:hypothetical protein